MPLAPETLRSIVRLQLARVARRVQGAFGASFAVEPSIEDLILSRLSDGGTGTRGIEGMLAATLLPDLSAQVLARLSAR